MEPSPLARKIQENFYLIQMLLGGAALVAMWIFFRPKEPESSFKLREADRKRPAGPALPPGPSGGDDLASARMKKAAPLLLEGFRAVGAPHEILGVAATASEPEIQSAYRELMKRYHPDLVGRPGSREWNDAQKIAETLNRARTEMLKRRKG